VKARKHGPDRAGQIGLAAVAVLPRGGRVKSSRIFRTRPESSGGSCRAALVPLSRPPGRTGTQLCRLEANLNAQSEIAPGASLPLVRAAAKGPLSIFVRSGERSSAVAAVGQPGRQPGPAASPAQPPAWPGRQPAPAASPAQPPARPSRQPGPAASPAPRERDPPSRSDRLHKARSARQQRPAPQKRDRPGSSDWTVGGPGRLGRESGTRVIVTTAPRWADRSLATPPWAWIFSRAAAWRGLTTGPR
jgi:hypothetical protein